MSLSLESAAHDSAERAALVASGQVTTFAALLERVRAIAGWLAAQGLSSTEPAQPLRPAAFVAHAAAHSFELVHALIALGVPFLPLHPRLTERERDVLVGECSARRLPDVPSDLPAGQPMPDVPDDERCLAVVPTSGSTGRPRGAILSRRAFAASARASEKNLGWRDDDRWLLNLPIAHVGGLSIVTRCLRGRRPVVLAEPGSFDPARLVRELERERITLASLVPAQLAGLLEVTPAWHAPPALRAVLVGGAAASARLLEQSSDRGLPVLATYGMTEACSQLATQRHGTLHGAATDVGEPLDGVELRIVQGEIQVRGPMLFSGYLPAAPANTYLDGDFFRTGDLGRLDASGKLHVLGRVSELIVTGGENVHPAEVEAAIERCPGVAAACVFGLPDERWGEIVAVALVARSAMAPDVSLIERHASSELASFKRPRLFAWLDALLLTPSGKLDRQAIAEAARSRLSPLGGKKRHRTDDPKEPNLPG